MSSEKYLLYYDKYLLTFYIFCDKIIANHSTRRIIMKKLLPAMIRFLLILMTLSTLAMAIFWTPGVIEYANSFASSVNAKGIITVSGYTVSSIISVTALAVFLVSSRFPSAIENDGIFTLKTAKLVKLIAILILVDSVFLFIAITALFILGDRLLSPALAFVDVIGIAISAMLFVLSVYVKDASYLKEEADYTL